MDRLHEGSPPDPCLPCACWLHRRRRTPTRDPDLVEASTTTGGIRGVVVDQAIRPLAGVDVELVGHPVATETDAQGYFTFGNLQPGAYVVRASHFLYDVQEVDVTVVANVRDPDRVQLQLTQKVFDKPYFMTQSFRGFITCSIGATAFASEECGEGVGVPCEVPAVGCQRIGGNSDNHVQYDFYVDGPGVKTLIVEMVWTPNAEQTGQLYTVLATDWGCTPVCEGNRLGTVAGGSPMYLRADVGDLNATSETRFSTFTWPNWGLDCEHPCLNVALNQDYDLFVTAFYVLPAPEGWSFVAGSPDPFK